MDARQASDNSTPLHLAVGPGPFRLEAFNLLMAVDANLTLKDNAGNTPLHKAAILGGTKGSNGIAMMQSILHVAVTAGQALIDDVNNQGCTALMLAVTGGNDATVRLLLDYGADPDIPNAERQHPLIAAAAAGSSQAHNSIIRMLIADPRTRLDRVDVTTKETVMHYAVRYSNVTMVGELIATRKCTDIIINGPSCEGRTPLHAAIVLPGNNKHAIIRLLVKGECILGFGI